MTRKSQCEYATAQSTLDDEIVPGGPSVTGIQAGRSDETAGHRTEEMAQELAKTKADYATLEKQQEELKSAMAKQQKDMMARLDALEAQNKRLQDELGNLQAASQLEVSASAATTSRRSVSNTSSAPAMQYEFGTTAGAGSYSNTYNTGATSGQFGLSSTYQQPYYTTPQTQQQNSGVSAQSTGSRGFPDFPYSNTTSSTGFWNQGR